MEDLKFTFETEEEYETAKSTGFIDWFDMVRMNIELPNGSQWDFPVKSKEECMKQQVLCAKHEQTVLGIYQSKHYYDFSEFCASQGYEY